VSGSVASAPINISALVPVFTPSLSPSNQQIVAGQTATLTLNISSNVGQGTLVLSCQSTALSTCGVYLGSTQISTVAIGIWHRNIYGKGSDGTTRSISRIIIPAFAIAATAADKRRRFQIIVLAFALTGCSSGSSPSNSPVNVTVNTPSNPASGTTYTVTVVGTMNNQQQQSSATLTVQ